MYSGDEFYDDETTSGLLDFPATDARPLVHGCICQTCADRGTECRGVCATEWDEQCPDCIVGNHVINERGQRMRRFAGTFR